MVYVRLGSSSRVLLAGLTGPMWLLLVIYLNFGDGKQQRPFVEDVKISGIHATDEDCHKKIDEIRRIAKERGVKIPKTSQMGCLRLDNNII